MDANEGKTPVRRSFVPGAAQEPSDPAVLYQPHVPDPGAPTEVFGAAVTVEPAAPSAEWDSHPSGHETPRAAMDGEPAPWYRRTWVLVAAGAAVVIALGVGIAMALGGGDGDPAALGSPSALPPVSEAPRPSAAPETLLDDGIAADDYPASAPVAGPGFPEALRMEDWVWDKVGPTWSLILVSRSSQTGGEGRGGVVYLASPEGRLFQLVDVPEEYGTVWLASWNEADHKARVEYAQPDSAVQGAAINLDSGQIEQMSFTIGGAPSSGERLLGSFTDGRELWAASDSTQYVDVLQQWTPGDGWKPGPRSDDLAMWATAASANGRFVAIEVHDTTASGFASERSGLPGRPHLVAIDMSTGQEALVRPDYGTSESWHYLSGITDDGTPVVASYSSDFSTEVRELARDGRALEPADAASFNLDTALYAGGQVVEPTAGLILTATAGEYTAYEVAVARTEGDPVTVLRAGDTLPFGGLEGPLVQLAAPDVALISDWHTCALVDTKFAVARVLVKVEGALSASCKGFGLANS